MVPKTRKAARPSLQVPKRGEPRPEVPKHNCDKATPEKQVIARRSSPRTLSAERKPSGGSVVRHASGVSPRKVSEGLKRLPPKLYSFVRECYLLLDSDNTGSVTRSTLRDMLASLGIRDSGDKQLNAMLERTGEPITYAQYLTVMGELLGDLPQREEMDMMLEAYTKPDGTFDQHELKRALLREGLTEEEIDRVIARFSKPSRYGEVFDPKAFADATTV